MYILKHDQPRCLHGVFVRVRPRPRTSAEQVLTPVPSLAGVEPDALTDPRTAAGVASEFGLARRGWDPITLVDFLARTWPMLCLPT